MSNQTSLPRQARIEQPHLTGRHCASTAVANVVNFHDLRWSEAFCFGMGGGLGAWYLGLPGISPSRLVHCRSNDFEQRFFERIGADFAWVHGLDAEQSEAAVKRAIVEQRLPMLLTNIYHLPYLDDIHFPGHVICAWAYDDDAGEFYVSDMHRVDLKAVPYEAMARARVSRKPPLTHDGHFFAPSSLTAPDDLPARVARAIVENSTRLMDESVSFQGMRALDTWQHELDAWPALDDWKHTARFAYEVIEKRGSGGGGFRLMYGEFLQEAATWLPRVAELGLPDQMMSLGKTWSALAEALRDASARDEPEFTRVAALLADVRARERAYHEQAIRVAD